MSLFEIYWRALRYLGADKRRVALICGANIILAVVTIAEPVLFGAHHRRHLRQARPGADAGAVGRAGRFQHRRLRSGGARRRPHRPCAPGRRALRVLRTRHHHAALLASPAGHVQRAAHAAEGRGRAVLAVARIHAPAPVDRRRAGAPGADRAGARLPHVDGAGDARRPLRRHRPAGHAQDQRRPEVGRAALPQGLRACDRLRRQRRRAAELQPHQPRDRGAAQPCALAALGAEPGARLVGARQRAASSCLDDLDDGGAVDRRVAGLARRTPDRRHRRLHRLCHAADQPPRPDLELRQPDLRGAGEARGLLQARGRFRPGAGAGRAARTRPRHRPRPLRGRQLSSSRIPGRASPTSPSR